MKRQHIEKGTNMDDNVDDYLLRGILGATALAGVAVASAYYLATRPVPETPLVPLHNQSPILEVSTYRI